MKNVVLVKKHWHWPARWKRRIWVPRCKKTDVKSIIKSLATNKAPGYDKISARVLKDSCERIAPVISRLVNNSFKMAAFPNAWKIAEVIPVPEEGNLEEPAHNRPISVTHPIESKWSERLAHKQFVEFLTTHAKCRLVKVATENVVDRNCPHNCYRQHFESSRWKICLVTSTAWYAKSFWQP